MKSAIHPRYETVTANCTSCGTAFVTRSTKPKLTVEVCSSCHPHYTGRARTVIAGNRVERFRQREARGRAARQG
jgi:large subunit ribosomal protein L31